MKITNDLTDDALLTMIGARLARLRLSKNLTQKQLADQAGLGVRTVQRLEQGASATQLSGLLRVCRVLGVLERFDVLVPEERPSPMQQLKLQGKNASAPAAQKQPPPQNHGHGANSHDCKSQQKSSKKCGRR
jgi:transcriptional regulator with XRE-family HTH domain